MNTWVGKRLGEYQILEQLGEGGLSSLYRAYQPGRDQYVALKILYEHLASDPKVRERYKRDGNLRLQMSHPNVIRVLEVGEVDGIPYVVHEYIKGQSLVQHMHQLTWQRQRLQPRVALHITNQVLAALGHIHGLGHVHRDIKPSKIMLADDGRVLLTSFGRAQFTDSLIDQMEMMGATPAYMAPEQGLGQPVDARSDLYSLGMVLYQMLTGMLPYPIRSIADFIAQHATGQLRPPREFIPDMPEAVERLVLKALQKRPDDRYQSAAEMAQATATTLSELPPETSVEPATPANLTTPSSANAAIAIQTQGDTNVGGDVVGRDKVTVIHHPAPHPAQALLEEAKQTVGVLMEYLEGYNFPQIDQARLIEYYQPIEELAGKLREHPTVNQALRNFLNTAGWIRHNRGRMNFPTQKEADQAIAELQQQYQAVVTACNQVLEQLRGG